jgi:sialate O-acetylesterase
VLAPIFTDHAVVQRNKAIPVWGTANPGEKIEVKFHGKSYSAVAEPNGHWMTYLDSSNADGVGADLDVHGMSKAIILRDIVVGDVWICSGQSNMAFPLQKAGDAVVEIQQANDPLIRQIAVEDTVALEPRETVVTTGWRSASPTTAGSFTAVGYFFARQLRDKLGIPIGLVSCSRSGSPIESWIDAETLASDSAFAIAQTRWRLSQVHFAENKAKYDKLITQWEEGKPPVSAGSSALQAYIKAHPKPFEPFNIRPSWRPSGLYNGMLHPIVPYALQGILWYQGESNVDHANEYYRLFSALIYEWRAHFRQGNLPFYWVQLPNYRSGDASGLDWAFLREAQSRALLLPNTGQATTIDIGDPDNIHPINKRHVGERLARIAEHECYGIATECFGPIFESIVVNGSSLWINFIHNDGLMANGAHVQSMQLAGADHIFHAAVGTVVGQSVIANAEDVTAPIAVRYAWYNSPKANLYNGSGLPAAPFRSDNWKQ